MFLPNKEHLTKMMHRERLGCLLASFIVYLGLMFFAPCFLFLLNPFDFIISVSLTLPETNIAPENGWLEYYFPIGEAYFQGLR